MIPGILAAVLAFTPADASLSYATASNLVANCTPRDAGTFRGRRAANFLLDRVSAETGADVRRDIFEADTPKGRRTFTNLLAEFRADASDEWIVVVSHYDTKCGTGCPGANDGASTSGLLAGLAQALRRAGVPPVNVVLLWTDGEECMRGYTDRDGFWGSRHAAEEFRREGRKLRAVICLDMLGDRDLAISLPKNTSPELRAVALAAAGRIGGADRVKEVSELVKDDHVAFQTLLGVPSVDLIDFAYGGSPGSNEWWHTPSDTVDKISVESLDFSGRLVVEMLSALYARAAE